MAEASDLARRTPIDSADSADTDVPEPPRRDRLQQISRALEREGQRVSGHAQALHIEAERVRRETLRRRLESDGSRGPAAAIVPRVVIRLLRRPGVTLRCACDGGAPTVNVEQLLRTLHEGDMSALTFGSATTARAHSHVGLGTRNDRIGVC